jgi:taurine dioxygenase
MLVELFDSHGLLLFRDQPISKAALLAAARHFGEPEPHLLGVNQDRETPEVAVVSTRGRDGSYIPASADEIVGRIDWHTDQAYTPTPNRATMMLAVEVPSEGGTTGFVDCQRVYDELSPPMKRRIEDLTVIQSWRKAQESISRNPNFRTDEGARMLELDRFPDLGYRIVQPHPKTGRKVLHAPPMWSAGLVELPGEDGRALLAQLFEHSLHPRFVHWQSYRPGDIIIWDNWRFMHAASGTKGRYQRLMYRTVLKGSVTFGRPLDCKVPLARADL